MAALLTAYSIKFLRVVLLVGLFMGAAAIGTYLTLTLMINGEDTVIVPNLEGKDVLVGLELLSDLGLNTRVKGIRYDDQVPQHHVIEQDPEPGSAIKRGRDVKIQVSRGPESIVMPNLSGLSLQQSRILLTQNGLCQGAISRMHSTPHPLGQVMDHYPSAGRRVTRRTCVDLLVSQGAPTPVMIMTQLTHMPLDAALRCLERSRLAAGRIHSVTVNAPPLDTVVDQTPPDGYRVSAGTRVDLTVNRFSPDGPVGDRFQPNGAELFRFTLESGFVNRRVQLQLMQGEQSICLADDFIRPGQEIWLLIPKSGNPTVRLFLDGQPTDAKTKRWRAVPPPIVAEPPHAR
jgi:serine/threonine-protein kinase